MRAGYMLVGGLVGWVTIGVVTAIPVSILLSTDGTTEQEQLYGSGLSALFGIVTGALIGRRIANKKIRRIAQPAATPPVRAHEGPQEPTPVPLAESVDDRPANEGDTGVREKLDELENLLASGYISREEHARLREGVLSGFATGSSEEAANTARQRPREPVLPGWYPDPDGDGERWWNGRNWRQRRPLKSD